MWKWYFRKIADAPNDLKLPWMLQGQRYPIHVQLPPSPKFHSFSLYNRSFQDIYKLLQWSLYFKTTHGTKKIIIIILFI